MGDETLEVWLIDAGARFEESLIAVGQRNSLSKAMLKKPRRKSAVRNLLTIRSEAPTTQVRWVGRAPQEFAVALEKTLAARKEMDKEKQPHVVDTTEEWKQLKEYAKTRDLAVKDDRIAARLQSTRIWPALNRRKPRPKLMRSRLEGTFGSFTRKALGSSH